jgi:hypothetical protein
MGAHCKTTILDVKTISQGIFFINISHVVLDDVTMTFHNNMTLHDHAINSI